MSDYIKLGDEVSVKNTEYGCIIIKDAFNDIVLDANEQKQLLTFLQENLNN